MTRPLRVAHISDLHVARAPEWKDFNLKRMLGRVNFLLFRRLRYKERVAEAAIHTLMRDPPDLVILTGDITQLGLEAEFAAVERLLAPVTGAGIPVVAVAGNHDIYGEHSRQRFERFRAHVALHLRQDADGIIRLPGVEILPLEQGVPGPPFMSRGRQGVEELELAAEGWREEPGDTVRLACGHYPVIDPHGGRLVFLHGLRELEILAAFCRDHAVAAYFCGHNHRRFSAAMPGGCRQFSAPALSDLRWAGAERASVYECRPGEADPVVEVNGPAG